MVLRKDEIIVRIQEAGVVGAGGAGFPTHTKLQAEAEFIVVNGAECEPLIQVDQGLMRMQADRLVAALERLAAHKQARGIFALKEKYHAAVDALKKAMEGTDLKMHLLPNYYPVGDEHVLVYETTGRVVPEGGIGPQVQVTVINVETLLNVANALDGDAVTEKRLTVIGEVEHPGTYIVPIGMRFQDILSHAAPKSDAYKLVEGGPMMGKLVENGVVTKTTKALLILPEEHILVRKKTTSAAALQRIMGGCCQCRECTDFCPRYLLGHNLQPHITMRSVGLSLHEGAWPMHAKSCSECGLCAYYVCPSGLSPQLVHQRLKTELHRRQVQLKLPQKESAVRNTRAFRQVLSDRLVAHLGLTKYNHTVPYGGALVADHVKILLKQGVVQASKPVVKTGETVVKGQVIAKPAAGQLGAKLHASISGKVHVKKDCLLITVLGEGEAQDERSNRRN